MNQSIAEPLSVSTITEVEEVILVLLSNLLGKDLESLRRQLLEKNGSMPVDSLDLFDVLSDFRRITRFKVPVRKVRRHTLRSISAFAEFVIQEGKR